MAKIKKYDPWEFHVNEKSWDLNRSFKYWRAMLQERLMRLFVWSDLPFPAREIERILLTSGACVIVDDPKAGVMVTYAALSGVTNYPDVFTHAVYSAPKATGGRRKIGDGCIYGYANSTQMPMTAHIEYYASLLAHNYMSIKMEMVNLRAQDVFSATDQQTKDNIVEWHKGLYEGKMLAIFDDSLAELPTTIQNLANTRGQSHLKDLLECQNDLIRNFYRDIGVRYTKEKRANMVADEVNSDSQLLMCNIEDMLFCRQEIRDGYNEYISRVVGNPTIDVKLNPIFTLLREETSNDIS